LIFFFVIVSFNYAQYAQSNEENNGYAVVYSIKQIIYDDGIDRIQYLPFDVFDFNGIQILSVGYNFDSPSTIKLPEGNYFIKFFNPGGDTISNEIIIEKDSIKNFSITNSPYAKMLLP